MLSMINVKIENGLVLFSGAVYIVITQYYVVPESYRVWFVGRRRHVPDHQDTNYRRATIESARLRISHTLT